MARILRMPALAANDSSTVLASWPLAEGDAFSAGDPVATVETDKAVVDVEADDDGVLLKTLVAEGARVAVGDPIAVLGEAGEVAAGVDALLGDLEQPPPPTEPAGAPAGASTGAQAAARVVAASAPSRVFASPLARRLAKESRLSLEEIHGSGPAGRIVRRDVEAALARRGGGTSPAAPAVADVSATRAVGYTDEPHSRMRAAIASALTASKQQIPHFYLRGSCRMDKLVALRQELCSGGNEPRISLNDLLVKAVARAQRLVPALNASWLPDAVRVYDEVDVAVAVATPGGLVTPVLRSVDTMPLSSVTAQMRDLVDRARRGQLRQTEIEGGGITLTNLGMFGVEEFAAIINPPQAAILAVGAVVEQPVVTQGLVEVAKVMRVTLSVDHRAVDGAVAAEWLRAFVDLVESPVQILV